MNGIQINGNDSIIERLSTFIRQKLEAEQADTLVFFAEQYFKYVAYEDLTERMLEDLYGTVLSHWNLALKRSKGGFNILVFNPSIEEHGWQSKHTVIEIVAPDMAFLTQSVTMEINRHGFTSHQLIHPVFSVSRDEQGQLIEVMEDDKKGKNECFIYVEINRQSNATVIDKITSDLNRILLDNYAATQDWQPCVHKMKSILAHMQTEENVAKNMQHSEERAFLQWLVADHFVFLAYQQYEFCHQDGEPGFKPLPDSGLGLFNRAIIKVSEDSFSAITKDVLEKYQQSNQLIISKATHKSTVHRPVFMDYIGYKQYDEQGNFTKEHRFYGLFGSSAYIYRLKDIPLVREKIKWIQKQSQFPQDSHDGKALLFVLQTLPRDELFQADLESLFTCVIGVLRLRERQRVKVLVRHDLYGQFASVLVFVPREKYHTDSRKKIQNILLEVFKGEDVDFSVQLSESILARIHFIIHSSERCCIEFDVGEIEQSILAALSEWVDDLQHELHNYYGEAHGNELYEAYKEGFSAAYREDFSPRNALLDLKTIELLEGCPTTPQCVLYSPLTATGKQPLRFKIYCCGRQASLSRSLPMLENMGVEVCDERPYEIRKSGDKHNFWLHDFGLNYARSDHLDLEGLKPRFQDAFEKCWDKIIDNDGFNRLIISAGLDWRQVQILRAYYFYMRQIGITFSQAYVQKSLAENHQVAGLLVELFTVRFQPKLDNRETQYQALRKTIEESISAVSSLDEDRILRRYFNLIESTVRTNYFNFPVDGLGVPYFSVKLQSDLVSTMPSPRPVFEIFVYSTRMEGIHLRGGKVARGGLRWSDRREDFRTEVLGLMKAQMTKNSVIVPTGAKGGFVVKQINQTMEKEKINREVVACYRILIRGMLDLTDNLLSGSIVKPAGVVCYDDDDAYLVVAADKGTATFSDYANELSKEYDFWLGDAFASGGSAGYDHKVMGITARGAWESVCHHFSRLGINPQTSLFTVIGIGGMAGDVFGNGMLLSDKLKLVAAFDHQSVFLDPEPDPAISFEERKRLFALPKSSWKDYQKDLLSAGGGVFSRSAKSIALNDEVKKVLAIGDNELTPDKLIKAILKAPVDLMWNGGIGTYVKAEAELNVSVGDKANDSVRVDATQLRCKVVGEGGNLGFTQSGRIEYALNGGLINTDSIDNSAGVDCSDHEVNIKIFLNSLLQKGDLTEKQRNQLLQDMTEQVAELVLQDNYQQNRAISSIEIQAASEPGMISRLIIMLEDEGGLNRSLENIPDNEILEKRFADGLSLTRPEISVLLAYGKQLLKSKLLEEQLFPDESLLNNALPRYFPQVLQERFPQAMLQHQLSREIVANYLVNIMVNHLGVLFPFRLLDEMGYSVGAIVSVYINVVKILAVEQIWQDLEQQDGRIDAVVLEKNKDLVRKAIERTMSWFLRRAPQQLVNAHETQKYISGLQQLTRVIGSLLTKQQQKNIDEEINKIIKHGLPAELAVEIIHLDVMFLGLDIIDIQQRTQCVLVDAAKTFFSVITIFELTWVREKILSLPKGNLWLSQARRSLREELNTLCCSLAIDILLQKPEKTDLENSIDLWALQKETAITRYKQMLQRIESEKEVDFVKITVLLNEMRNVLN